jgi:hypothetical protein
VHIRVAEATSLHRRQVPFRLERWTTWPSKCPRFISPRSALGALNGPLGPAPLTWSDSSETSSPPPSPGPREGPSTPTVQHLWELPSYICRELVPYASSGVPTKQKAHDPAKRVPQNATSFTILQSIHFQTIPRPLRIPLSLIPPEHLRVSDVPGGELDLTLCVPSSGE